MEQAWILDWTAIAAFFAAGVALLSSLLLFISSRRRNQFEAIIEICKIREQWLNNLRKELVGIYALYDSKVDERIYIQDLNRFLAHRSQILLLVDSSNPHWNSLRDRLDDMESSFKLGGTSEPKNYEFVGICRRILEQEKMEIESLLIKGKYNAKNK